MKKLGTDKQKAQALNTGAMHACHILNNLVMPICRDLSFTIDTSDTETLDCYLRDLSALHSDYISKMREGANNPALAVVLEKTAEELWEKAKSVHPLANPYIINDIPKDIIEYLTLTGSDVTTFHARPNNPAIEKACTIEASQEDIEKQQELKEVCAVLNRCFNGHADLLFGYLGIDRGQFVLRDNITNFRPIYGE